MLSENENGNSWTIPPMSGCGLWGDLICSAWGLAGLPRLPCRLSWGLKSFHASNILKLWKLMGIDWDKVWLMIRWPGVMVEKFGTSLPIFTEWTIWKNTAKIRLSKHNLRQICVVLRRGHQTHNPAISWQFTHVCHAFNAWGLTKLPHWGFCQSLPNLHSQTNGSHPLTCESYNFVSTNVRIPGMVKGKT